MCLCGSVPAALPSPWGPTCLAKTSSTPTLTPPSPMLTRSPTVIIGSPSSDRVFMLITCYCCRIGKRMARRGLRRSLPSTRSPRSRSYCETHCSQRVPYISSFARKSIIHHCTINIMGSSLDGHFKGVLSNAEVRRSSSDCPTLRLDRAVIGIA